MFSNLLTVRRLHKTGLSDADTWEKPTVNTQACSTASKTPVCATWYMIFALALRVLGTLVHSPYLRPASGRNRQDFT